MSTGIGIAADGRDLAPLHRPLPAWSVAGLGRAPRWLLLLWGLAAGTTVMLMAAEGLEHAGIAVVWGGALLLLGRASVHRIAPDPEGRTVHLFTGAFLARYAFAAVLLSALAWSGSPLLAGASDYFHYERFGWAQAELWRAGDFRSIITFADAGYYYLVAAVYTVAGRFLVAPTLVSAVFGGFAAVVTLRLGTRLFGSRVGWIAGVLAAVLPTLLFWSGLLYKDTIVSFLYVSAVYAAVCLRNRFSWTHAVMLGLSIGPLFVFRTGIAAVLAVLAGVFLLLRSSGFSGRRVVAVGIAGILLFMLAALSQNLGIGGGGVTGGIDKALRMLQDPGGGFSAEMARRGGDGLTRAIYGTNLLTSPHLLAAAVGLLFFSPIPGTAPLGMNTVTFLLPGQLVWLALLPALAIGVLRLLRERTPGALFLFAAAGLGVLGIVLGGFFSNPRYLVQVMPLLLIVVGVGIVRLGRLWYAYFASACLAVCAIAAYGLVR